MTQQQLRSVMRFQLRHLAPTGTTITDNTVHSTVVSTTDGTGVASSARIYKTLIRFTLVRNGEGDPNWPATATWLAMTVTELAAFLLP